MRVVAASDLLAGVAHRSERSDAAARDRTFDASVIIAAVAGDHGDRAAAVAVEAAQLLRAVLDRSRPHDPPGLMILELRIAQQQDGLWVAQARRIDEGSTGGVLA
jgi:hypothetical protein